MAGQPYCTGPVSIYVAAGVGKAGSSARFLGHGEYAPQQDIQPAYDPFLNDLGGTRIPFDTCFEGEEAFVSVVLTRWDETVYKLFVVNRPSPGGSRGLNVPGDIGSMMLFENFAHTLWCVHPYQAKAAFSTMPAGYRYVASMVRGPDTLKGGTTARKVAVNWHCLRQYLPTGKQGTNATAPATNFQQSTAGGSFLLYDHDMTGLPAVT